MIKVEEREYYSILFCIRCGRPTCTTNLTLTETQQKYILYCVDCHNKTYGSRIH